jgi:hypothetical protein
MEFRAQKGAGDLKALFRTMKNWPLRKLRMKQVRMSSALVFIGKKSTSEAQPRDLRWRELPQRAGGGEIVCTVP